MRFSSFTFMAASAVFFCGGERLSAQTFVDWNVADGDWNLDANWTSAFGSNVPSADFSETARINNGGTAVVSGAVPDVTGLAIPNGTVIIENSGSLSVLEDVTVGGNGLLHLRGNGSLSVGGNSSNSVRIAGPDVQYEVDGNYSSTNRFMAEITGNSHSEIQVGGTATLGGALQVELNGVDPAFGQSWPLLSAASVDGGFQSVESLSPLPRGLRFQAVQNGGDVSVAVSNSLVLTIDRLTGAGTVENPVGGPVDVKGYSILSANGLLSPQGWSSLADNSVSGWEEANPAAGHLSELNLLDSSSLPLGGSVDVGTPYVPGPQSPHEEDVVFRYLTTTGEVVDGLVEYLGPVSDLVLTVDPETGEGAISNLSPFFAAPDVKGYAITSPSASLNPDNWISFQASGAAGDGWEEANPLPAHLAELNLLNSTLFSTNTLHSLGELFEAGGTQDLVFEYITTAGEVLAGTVEYGAIPDVLPPGLASDFNKDGTVDLADFNILKGNFGTGGAAMAQGDANMDGNVDLSDFNILKGQFGQSAAQTVPEPSAGILALVAMAIVAWLIARRRHRVNA